MLSLFHGFKVCRVCLSPSSVDRRVSLFDGKAERSKAFEDFTGLDIQADRKKNHDVLICDHCSELLSKHCRLREQIRKNERFYFAARRVEEIGFDTFEADPRFNYKFDVCRACLTPQTVTELLELFGKNAVNAQKYQAVGTIDIFFDENKHKALICPKCANNLDEAFKLRSEIRKNDLFYFEQQREESAVNSKEKRVKPSDNDSEPAAGVEERKKSGTEIGKTSKRQKSAVSKSRKSKLRCNLCRKKYSTKSSLQEHINMVHEKIKNFICDLCPMKFYHKSNMKDHIARVHIFGKKVHRPFKCQVKGCDKSFKWKCSLKIHQKKHEEFVSSVTETEALQKTEILVTTPKNSRSIQNPSSGKGKGNDRKSTLQKWKCSICGKSLSTKHNLKKHLDAVHLKIKRFRCDLCDETFYRKGDLGSHMEHRHINSVAVYDQSRPFPCSFEKCLKRFQFAKDLKLHEKRTHSNERLFVCHCKKAFKRKDHLKDHQKAVH